MNRRNLLRSSTLLSTLLLPLNGIVSNASKTTGEATWWVSPSGTDAPDRGQTKDTAFRTLQYAYDQLPEVILHQQTITLTAGTHDENYLQADEMVKKAMLYAHGKSTGIRTDRSTGTLTGAIVIKGETGDPSGVTLRVAEGYEFGIYNGQGQLALEDFAILAGGEDETLLVSHRNDSYVHVNNLILDGNLIEDDNGEKIRVPGNKGMYAESGGQIEMTGLSQIRNCEFYGAAAITQGSYITLSDSTVVKNCGVGLSIRSGTIAISGTSKDNSCMVYACNLAVSAVRGQFSTSAIVNESKESKSPIISSPCKFILSRIYSSRTEFRGNIDLTQSDIFFDNCIVSPALKINAYSSSIADRKSDVEANVVLANNSTYFRKDNF